PDDPYQQQALAAMFAGHAGGHEHLAMFYGMQLLWEETMAESIINYLDSPAGQDKKMVVLAGGFHVAYGFGIPRKVLKQRKWPYTIVLPTTPAELEENEPRRMEVDFPELPLYVADYLWCIPYRNLNDSRVCLGVQLQDTESGVKIMLVQPGSAAAAAGIEPEDVVKVIDGQPVQKSQDLQYAILDKKIGDRSRLTLNRGGRQVEVEVLFIAPAGNEQK
ncbi:MAG: ChaN family lipoprotein, partial [Deltaproteobacteria bacterium]|nr:ChaN family lipoprotein [Deltaproteobacteria bacterium]